MSSTIDDIEVSYNTFVSLVFSSLESAIPGRGPLSTGKPPVRHPPCLWWSPKCDKLIRLRKAALARFKFSGLREDFLRYKPQIAQTHKSQQDSFRKFCSNLRKDSNLTYIWNVMKRFEYR